MEHIFLTDNLSDDAGVLLADLANMFPPELLTLRTEKYERAQLKTYAWCIEQHRHRFNWMAFIDMDEYLVVQSGCAPALLSHPHVHGSLCLLLLASQVSVHDIPTYGRR